MKLLEMGKPLAVLRYSLLILSSVITHAQNTLNPKAILERMAKAYRELSTYQDIGVVETTVNLGTDKQTLTRPFSITFKRPRSVDFKVGEPFSR